MYRFSFYDIDNVNAASAPPGRLLDFGSHVKMFDGTWDDGLEWANEYAQHKLPDGHYVLIATSHGERVNPQGVWSMTVKSTKTTIGGIK